MCLKTHRYCLLYTLSTHTVIFVTKIWAPRQLSAPALSENLSLTTANIFSIVRANVSDVQYWRMDAEIDDCIYVTAVWWERERAWVSNPQDSGDSSKPQATSAPGFPFTLSTTFFGPSHRFIKLWSCFEVQKLGPSSVGLEGWGLCYFLSIQELNFVHQKWTLKYWGLMFDIAQRRTVALLQILEPVASQSLQQKSAVWNKEEVSPWAYVRRQLGDSGPVLAGT